MASLTVRNHPDATHRSLKLLAQQNGRSTEAEFRLIPEAAMAPRLGLGSALAAVGRSLGGMELDIRRDATAVDPAVFE